MAIILLLIGLIPLERAHAYPEFIGYKYASCLTCHFNGHGNGPLNDYGRALWANEIAARTLAFGRTDEQLAEASGFLGSKQLPWWIRPGIKGRGLLLRPSPGGNGESRFILMQGDVNVALFFDQDQKYAFVGSYGTAPVPQRLANSPDKGDVEKYISREHYVRVQLREPLWLYVGMMDKVYGIRQVDHSSAARARVGVAQSDQAHGLIAHYIQPTWEASFNAYMGNLFQDAELRQKGMSMMYEWDLKDAFRAGVSAMLQANKFVDQKRLGFHVKRGYGHGSAVLGEVGLLDDLPAGGGKSSFGYYAFGEHIQRFKRGYHFFISGNAYKQRLEKGKGDSVRANFGLLAFPFQRAELRLELQTGRQIQTDTENVSKDSWALLTQLHFSL